MKKIKKPDGLYLLGKAAEEVTGSMYLIVWNQYKILIECGLYQSSRNNYFEAYKVNTEKFDFDPAEIDYILVCHAHVDHTGLIMRLYKEGCRAPIIMRHATKEIVHYLWPNSAYILQTEAARMGKSKGRVYEPVYTLADVDLAESHIQVYDTCDKLYQLNDQIKFQWLTNSHCIGAAQLQLILTDDLRTRKILYTSDMGKFKPDNDFVNETEIPNFFNDYTLMESTYGDPNRTPKKTRKKDLGMLKAIIETTYERHGQVIMPAFSFAKSQQLLIDLYRVLKDSDIPIRIYVDSMLTTDLSRKAYPNALIDDDLLLWREVLNWDKLEFLREKDQSLACLADDHSKVVIAASGFATNGRVIEHLRKNVKDENSVIVLSGYAGSNNTYLAYRLWKNKTDRKIKIEGKEYPYRANLMTLDSYSSHAPFEELVYYGSHIRTNKLILVHGDMEVKEKLAQHLEKAISKEDKTHQVIIGRKGMFLPL